MKKLGVIILVAVLIAVSLNSLSFNTSKVYAGTEISGKTAKDFIDFSDLYGFATVSGEGLETTTGGGNSTPQLVTNITDLKSLCSGNTPRVIVISGTINSGSDPINVGSNKTIVGIDSSATLKGGFNMNGISNIIISNLNIDASTGSADAIAARDCDHLWLDHLNLKDASDGIIDLTLGSDYMTVSWCKMSYSSSSMDHRLCSLLGSGGGDHDDTDMGKLNATYHHNWFAENVNERMPRLMYGKAHIYNNYYSCTGNSYCIGCGSYGAVLVQNNYFNKVKSPHIFMYADRIPCSITANGNEYYVCSGSKDTGLGGGQFGYVAPFENTVYDYKMDKAADVPDIVTNGAGPRNVLESFNNTSKGETIKGKDNGEPLYTAMPVPTAQPVSHDKAITYDKTSDTYTYNGNNKDGSNAAFKITNPYKGMDLDEGIKTSTPNWTKGASISMWVYLPSSATDASILTFNLDKYREIHFKDKVHYQRCQQYSSFDTKYNIGTEDIYIDENGKEYKVMSGSGSLACYNPFYPAEGAYRVSSNGGTYAHKKGETTEKWVNLEYLGDAYYQHYSMRYDETDGKDSWVREAAVDGSLCLYASGTMGFRQDNTTAIQLNPNFGTFGHVENVMGYNQFYYWGNGSTYTKGTKTPTMTEKDKWHFIVVVMKNDWIQYYMDGKEISMNYLNWWGSSLSDSNSRNAAGRFFNCGFGFNGNYLTNSPISENAQAMSVMDFITNDNTSLYIGGTGNSAERLGQNTIMTPQGVQLKNIKFYAKALNKTEVGADTVTTTEKELAYSAIDMDKPEPSSGPSSTATPKPEATATPKPEATATPKPEATATPKPEATATPKPEATATPKPEATATPKPTESAAPTSKPVTSPVPTQEPLITAAPGATLRPVTKSLNDAAVEKDGYYYFKQAVEDSEGVEISNPFAGLDTSNGAAICFWLRPSIEITPSNFDYISMITFVGGNNFKVMKFDLHGTRQYQDVENDKKINYYNVSMAMSNDDFYYISIVIGPDGLEMYRNGEAVGYIEYSYADQPDAKEAAMELISKLDTRVYLGGSETVYEEMKVLGRNRLPEGTIIGDITEYNNIFNPSDIEKIYNTALATKPTVPPDAVTPKPEITSTPEAQTPVPGKSEAPEPTSTPTPSETISPGLKGDVNGDENVNANDALLILRHAAKLETIPDIYIDNADVEKDNNVDAKDALKILQYVARLIETL